MFAVKKLYPLNPATQNRLEREDHEQKWAPIGRTRETDQPKQLVMLIKSKGNVEETKYSTKWHNPGPNARWCDGCQDYVSDGIATVKRTGTRATEATWTAVCPFCETVLRDKP